MIEEKTEEIVKKRTEKTTETEIWRVYEEEQKRVEVHEITEEERYTRQYAHSFIYEASAGDPILVNADGTTFA